MHIEVLRFPGHPTIVMLDGKPFPAALAAQKLGMSRKTFVQRVRRGSDLRKPLQRHVFE